jgi:hypothetical protein
MRTTVIVGANFSAALTMGKQPIVGHSPLPVLAQLGPALLRHVEALEGTWGSAFSAFPHSVIQEAVAELKPCRCSGDQVVPA